MFGHLFFLSPFIPFHSFVPHRREHLVTGSVVSLCVEREGDAMLIAEQGAFETKLVHDLAKVKAKEVCHAPAPSSPRSVPHLV